LNLTTILVSDSSRISMSILRPPNSGYVLEYFHIPCMLEIWAIYKGFCWLLFGVLALFSAELYKL